MLKKSKSCLLISEGETNFSLYYLQSFFFKQLKFLIQDITVKSTFLFKNI